MQHVQNVFTLVMLFYSLCNNVGYICIDFESPCEMNVRSKVHLAASSPGIVSGPRSVTTDAHAKFFVSFHFG